MLCNTQVETAIYLCHSGRRTFAKCANKKVIRTKVRLRLKVNYGQRSGANPQPQKIPTIRTSWPARSFLWLPQNQRFCPAPLPEDLKISPPPSSCCIIKK